MQESADPDRNFIDRLKQNKVLLACLGLVFLVIVFFIGFHIASNYAESKFVDFANSELGPHSEIVYDQFSIGLFPIKASVTNIRVNHLTPLSERTPKKPGDAIRSFHADKIELRNLNIYRLIREDHVGLGSLSVEGVDLELILPSAERIRQESSETEISYTLSIDNIDLRSINAELFRIRDSDGDTPAWTIKNFNLHLDNLNTKKVESGLHNSFENITAKIEHLKHLSENSYYTFTADSIQLNSLQQEFSIASISMTPRQSTYELAMAEQYATDSFTINSGPIKVEGLDILNLLENEELRADHINLHELSVVIAREKTFPREPRDERTMPHADFAELPYRVDIDSIRFKKGFVSYTEQHSDVGKSGTITFSDIDLTIKSLQNHTNSEPIPVNARARFMETSDLDLEFEFYATPLASHSISGKLSSMDLSAINHPLEGMAAANIEEGELTSLDFSFNANDYGSNGELTIIYNDLKIQFLDSDSFEEDTGANIKSFIANTFAVRADNSIDDPRVGTIEFERDKERSMFNFWWKTIQSGLMETVKR